MLSFDTAVVTAQYRSVSTVECDRYNVVNISLKVMLNLEPHLVNVRKG